MLPGYLSLPGPGEEGWFYGHIALFVLLLLGFILLLLRLEILKSIRLFLLKTRHSIDEKDRETRILRRENLREFEKKNSLYLRLERQIEYSGLRRRFESLSAGKLIVFEVIFVSAVYALSMLLFGYKAALIFAGLGFGTIQLILVHLKSRNLRAVNDELPKLLDFLGNYSYSSAEVISILSQISKYLEEPLRSALEECEMESRLTGDVNLALASMADKIEHPQFKQLVRNIEITSRYGADFTTLVSESRKSMRDYMSANADRRGMLSEAAINMGLLIVMSLIVLMVVNIMIGGGIINILFTTFVGHLAIAGMVFIFILFISQMFSLNK